MLKMNGSSLAVNGAASRAATQVQAMTARPWEAAGSVAIDRLLTWAIFDQRAGEERAGLYEQEAAAEASMRGRAFHWNRRSTDGVAKIEEIGMLNSRVDVSRGMGNSKVSDVADAVWLAASASREAEAVIAWARIGTAPDGWAWPSRRTWPRLGWVVEGVEGVTVYEGPGRTGQATLVSIVSRIGIEAARRRYQLWWDALEAIAWELSGLALGFVITPPSVSRAPWQAIEALDDAAII